MQMYRYKFAICRLKAVEDINIRKNRVTLNLDRPNREELCIDDFFRRNGKFICKQF